MSLFTYQVKYREYIIPAPNVGWYKYEVFADISQWDGSVKKLYVEIYHRDGRKYRQEISRDNLLRIHKQTELIHYLFKYGIKDDEIQTIKSDSFISKIVTYRFYTYKMAACHSLGGAYGPDITYENLRETKEEKLEYKFFGLKLWELYYENKRPYGVGSNTDWLHGISPSKTPVPDTVFLWTKQYISSDNHYKEWKSQFGYLDRNGYGRTFEDGGFM